MTATLRGCQAKIDRTREHLDALKTAAHEATETGTNRLIVEDKGDWKIVKVQMCEPPIRLSVIAGDIVHNLRSGLDHLAWQLVLVSKMQPGGWTYFPLYGVEDYFDRDVRNRLPRRGKGPLHGIDPTGPIWALIESLQPYHSREPVTMLDDRGGSAQVPGPKTHRLAILSMLSRIDKHRKVYEALRFPASERDSLDLMVQRNPEAVPLEERHRDLPGQPLKDGTKLMWLRFDPAGPDPDVRVEGVFPTYVALGDEDDALALGGFDVLVAGVEEVIDLFKPFFP